jgi:hypothetical protein
LRDDIWIRYLQHVTGLLRTGFLSYSRTIGVHAFAVTTPPYYGVVVPDVRFDNEVEFFAEREYPILRVVRPDTDLMANTVGVQNHASEIASTAIDNRRFTAIIDNSGPLSHLLLTGEMLANVYRPRRAND